jgi:hypothetical protein
MRFVLLAAVVVVLVVLGYYGVQDMRRYFRLRSM